MRVRNLGFLAVAAVLSVTSSFALAKGKGGGASYGDVLQACVDTPGCQMNNCNPPKSGCGQGCSPVTCFSCKNNKCVATRGLGGKPTGGSLSGILKNAPIRGTSSSNAGNKPVNETPTRNMEPVTERAGGKH
jgi:hypothetical protein